MYCWCILVSYALNALWCIKLLLYTLDNIGLLVCHFVDLEMRKSPNFTTFSTRHLVVAPPSGKVEYGCTTANLPLSNDIKTTSKFQRLLGGRSLKLYLSRAWQTDQQTQTQHFWLCWQRAKSEHHRTWQGDRGPQARSCISKKSSEVWCTVSLLGGAENLGVTRPVSYKPP